MCKKQYTFLNVIGRGGQGVVYLAIDHLSHQQVCIKQLPKSIVVERKAVDLMKKVKHPNFPKVLDEFEDEYYYYQVMEYVDGKTLESSLNKLSVAKTIDIGLRLLEMIDDLKNHGLTFNDLKPDNILITQHNNIYIVDYGAVLLIGDDISKRYGSLYFSSPEYRQRRKVTWKSDLYSIGKILKYICRKPNYHLEKWIQKACHHQEEKRFSTLIEAYFTLKKAPSFLYCLFIFGVVSLWFFLNGFYKNQIVNLPINTKESVVLFHSLNCYQLLDEDYKYHLSNQILDVDEAFYWEIQQNLCNQSKHPQLLDREAFLKTKSLNGISLEKENLKFYIQYLLFLKDYKSLRQAYHFLKKQVPTRIIQTTQIAIAFYLKEENWLLNDFVSSESEIQAYSLYCLFQLGYYNRGYLHQALTLLDQSSHEQLINKITVAIDQWGIEA